MSDSVTIAKAIIEVGATGADAAKDEIQTLETRLAKLDAQYNRGNITLSAYAKRTQKLKDDIAALKGGIEVADQRMKQFGNTQQALASLQASGATKSAAASRGASQAMMEFGRGVEDFATGGFLGGLNNIPRMIEGIGQSAGVAGAKLAAITSGISLAATAAYMLYKSGVIQKFVEDSGLFAEATEKVADEIDGLKAHIAKLEDKPVKLAVDTFEIDQAKKKLEELESAARAFKQMGESASPGEKASGEAIGKKFSELGVAKGDQIQGDLKAKMATELIAQSETIKEADREAARAAETQKKAEARLANSGSQGATMQALGDIETAKARVKVAQDAAAKARREINKEGGEAEREIGKIWADATKGNVEAQKKLVARLKAIGQNALATSIESVSPKLMEPNVEDPEVARTNAFNEAVARKAREARSAEDSRLAGAMAGSVGQKYLSQPGMSDEGLQAEVKRAMQKAGMSAKDIGDAMAGTAKKLRENLDKAVKDRALDRGIAEGTARQQLAKEAQERDDKQAGSPKAEVMSTGAYLNKLLVASVSKPDATAEKALVAQQDTAKGVMKFADLAEKWEARGIKVIGKDNPARVAPGR